MYDSTVRAQPTQKAPLSVWAARTASMTLSHLVSDIPLKFNKNKQKLYHHGTQTKLHTYRNR